MCGRGFRDAVLSGAERYDLDLVAVRIAKKRSVVVSIILIPDTWRTVVDAAGGQTQPMKIVDGVSMSCMECDM